MENETGDTYYLHMPLIPSGFTVYQYVIGIGKLAKKIVDWSNTSQPDPATGDLLDELPFEEVP